MSQEDAIKISCPCCGSEESYVTSTNDLVCKNCTKTLVSACPHCVGSCAISEFVVKAPSLLLHNSCGNMVWVLKEPVILHKHRPFIQLRRLPVPEKYAFLFAHILHDLGCQITWTKDLGLELSSVHFTEGKPYKTVGVRQVDNSFVFTINGDVHTTLNVSVVNTLECTLELYTLKGTLQRIMSLVPQESSLRHDDPVESYLLDLAEFSDAEEIHIYGYPWNGDRLRVLYSDPTTCASGIISMYTPYERDEISFNVESIIVTPSELELVLKGELKLPAAWVSGECVFKKRKTPFWL